MTKYTEGQVIELRTQSVIGANDEALVVFYPHWDGMLACEGWQIVTLTEHEASALNKYGRFHRSLEVG